MRSATSSSSSTSAAARRTSRRSRRSTATARSSSRASRSATTSCSAATTWTSPSRTWSAPSSRQQGKEVDRWQMAALTHRVPRGEGGASVRTRSVARPPHRDRRARLEAPRRRAPDRAHARRGHCARSSTATSRWSTARGAPRRARRAAASRSSGLPYAQDAAVTRHLAAFLARQADATTQAREGVPASVEGGERAGRAAPPHGAPVQRRRHEGERAPRAHRRRRSTPWLAADGAPPVRVLEGGDLDLAVARGAAAYGLARRGTRPAHPRGHGARVLRRHREPGARGAGGRAADHRAVPRAVRDGGGDGREAPAARARRRRRREGPLPVLRLERASRGRCGGRARAVEGRTSSRSSRRSRSRSRPKGRREGDVVPVRLHAAVTEVGTLLLEAIPTAPSARRTSAGRSSSTCARRRRSSRAWQAAASSSASTSGRRTRSSPRRASERTAARSPRSSSFRSS